MSGGDGRCRYYLTEGKAPEREVDQAEFVSAAGFSGGVGGAGTSGRVALAGDEVAGVQRSIRRTRALRRTTVLVVILDAVALAVSLAEGSAGRAGVAAVTIAVLLVLMVVQTRQIGTLQWARHLNWRADQLELAARALGQARPCAHPDAEPVDLSTGERVAWVCPSCDAELPAGWTPPAPGPALKPDRIVMAEPSAPVGGPALACECGRCDGSHEGPGMRWFRDTRRADGGVRDVAEAALHFAQLARVGRGVLCLLLPDLRGTGCQFRDYAAVGRG